MSDATDNRFYREAQPTSKELAIGQVWAGNGREARVLAVNEGYVMARHPHAAPFVAEIAKFRERFPHQRYADTSRAAHEPCPAPGEANEIAGALYAAMASVNTKPVVCEAMRRAARYLEQRTAPGTLEARFRGLVEMCEHHFGIEPQPFSSQGPETRIHRAMQAASAQPPGTDQQRDADRYAIVRDKCAVYDGKFRLPTLDKYQLAGGQLISGGQRLDAAIDAYLADDSSETKISEQP